MLRRAFLAGFVVLASMTGGSSPVRADDVQQAVAWLDSSSVDEVRLGIETLGLHPSPASATAIVNRGRRGMPADVLEVALATLGAMQQPAAKPWLLELTRHRRATVRAAALTALAGLPGDDSRNALRRGVDDADAVVRAAAIAGLGALDDRGAVPLLLRAFDRGAMEAAEVIGRLGGPSEVEALLGYVGHIPLDQILGGFGQALSRTDLPQRLRLDIVARLTELATSNVRAFFESLLPSLPGNANDAVRRAVSDAIVRISG